MTFSMESPRLADSLVGAGVNGLINGLIAWSAFKGSESVPLSMDSIGAPGITALGNAATVAFSLSALITCITFFVFRSGARKAHAPAALANMAFLPTGLAMALMNTAMTFGAFVALAVLWQRLMGTVSVSPFTAALVVAAVALVSTGIAEWRTKREMLASVRALP